MGFPVLLVLLFFLTWNFNPSVLYSPSDYRTDETFLLMLTKKYKNDVENNMGELEAMLVDVKKEIMSNTVEVVDDKIGENPISAEVVEGIVDNKINNIIDKLDETRQTTAELTRLIGSNISAPTKLHKKENVQVFHNSKDLAMTLREIIDSYIMKMPYGDSHVILTENLAREYACSILKNNQGKIVGSPRVMRESVKRILGLRRIQVLLQLIEGDPELNAFNQELCYSVLAQSHSCSCSNLQR